MNETKQPRRAFNLISIVVFLFAAVFYLVSEQHTFSGKQGQEGLVQVVEVHDGDTVSVIMDKKREKVRLTGIDAPEMGQKPWGEEAKDHLQSLLRRGDWRVRLEYDVEQRDIHGRILAYMRTADGQFINLLMVKNGFAVLYTVPPNVRYVKELTAAQAEAREKRSGIWGDKGLQERPGDYRREHPRK